MSNLSERMPAASQTGDVTSGDHPALVSIEFVRDIAFGDKSVDYRRGSRWLVNPGTATALILVGAAVRVSIQSSQRAAT
jgi:hypothetical protein